MRHRTLLLAPISLGLVVWLGITVVVLRADALVPPRLNPTLSGEPQSGGLAVAPTFLLAQLPPDQRTVKHVSVGNQGSTAMSFEVTIAPGSSPAGAVPWLTVSPTAGFLDPGAETVIDVRFDSSSDLLPTSDPALYSADIRVDSDSLSEPRVLTVTAIMEVVSPTISPVISPTSLSAQVMIGATAQQTMTLDNEGNATMVFTLTIPVAASSWLSASPQTGTMPAEGRHVLTATFDASGVTEGVHQADLIIETDSETTPTLTVPATITATAPPSFRAPVYNGPERDLQPAMIRVQPSGHLMLVFERDDPVTRGDLYLVTSADGGQTWSTPSPLISSSLDERHPALVQLANGSFALFYAVEEEDDDPNPYRIHRATSSDGINWVDQGAIDLGWTMPGEVAPSVIYEENGTLTMTYHRRRGTAYGYLAQSTDGGLTWDTGRTEVAEAEQPLPRIAKRESDGLYLITYQVDAGGGDWDLYARVSTDPYNWSDSPIPVSVAVSSHDARPLVLEDGAFVLFYAAGAASSADLYYRLSCDGVHWSGEVQVTTNPVQDDTQPYALRHGIPGRSVLAWAHQEVSGNQDDYDVWVDNDLRLRASLCGATKRVTPAIFDAALRPLTYTLSLLNPGLTTTVDLVDPLPVDTAYEPASLWATNGRYGYDPVGEVITWTGVVSTGDEITIQFEVTTTRLLSDTEAISNTAHLTDAGGLAYTIEALAVADDLPPVSTIIDPVAGQYISYTTYIVDGVAVDAVSGVAEVAISVDGGAWQPATGHKLWYYQWTGYTDGEHNLRSRAADALGHVEAPGAGITVTVDTVPPVLLAHRPAAEALDVPLTATVVLTFSEPILPGSLRFSCVPAPDDWSVSWNAAGTVAYLTPSTLAGGKLHAFTVSKAHDYARNGVQPVAWSFTTEPYPPIYLPLVVAHFP